LDSDELDDDSTRNLDTPVGIRRNADQQMPLLVGLYDTSHSRRSLDASMPLHERDGGGSEHVDLEDLAAKRTAGGGMFDSIANMANSILGAGELLSHTLTTPSNRTTQASSVPILPRHRVVFPTNLLQASLTPFDKLGSSLGLHCWSSSAQ
jgi:hypothetical protein